MQTTTKSLDFEDDHIPTGDPLAGSGFEQEQPDPDFFEQDAETAEAN